MNHETQTNSKSKLTRKQKLARHFMPVALLAAGASAYGANELLSDNDTPKAEATVLVHASAKFEGGEEGWGHKTAQNLILYAVGKGAMQTSVSTMETAADPSSVAEMAESLPVYDQATEALEMAHYNDVVPDVGDILTIEVEVTTNSDQNVSYEVVSAEIKDISNNQD
ncbi:hypothetical protein H7142_00440 [Candidatus Saccharibacteria bacterium]|nr:hypothetical protein [Candidatus Saccharibacteria bacterium]